MAKSNSNRASDKDKGLRFSEVQQLEQDYLRERRRCAGFKSSDPSTPLGTNDSSNAERDAQTTSSPDVQETIGLALSGGGIRSASLGLGFIQALRRHGMLRYVDYLSAISGGSYTTALVSSSFYHSSGDVTKPKNQRDVRLDVDLSDETKQPARVRALAGNGRYLIRPIEWANRFLSGWFLLLLVVVSGLLSASALIAFLLRLMDLYSVRNYLRLMGVSGDLAPALLPLTVLFLAWIVLWSLSRLKDEAAARGRSAKKVLVVLTLCAIGTIAALIGNGDIAFSSGVSKTVSFLKFPLFVAILGGVIPVFFRDRLFKSGRRDSTLLEKLVYRYTAIAVVLGIPMLLIGFFAREDISRFNASRDGRLLYGDVKDVAAFSRWFKSIIDSPTEEPREHILGFLASSSGELPDESTNEHLIYAQVQAFAQKIVYAPGLLKAAPPDHSVTIDVDSLIEETANLRAAQRELMFRIAGKPRWHARQCTVPHDIVTGIGGTTVVDVTEIKADNVKPWVRRKAPARIDIIPHISASVPGEDNESDASETNATSGATGLPLDPTSLSWKDWTVWNYIAAIPPWSNPNEEDESAEVETVTVPGATVLPLDPVSDPDSLCWKDWISWKYETVLLPWRHLAGHLFPGDADNPFGAALLCEERLVDREAKLLSVFNEVCLVDPMFGRMFNLAQLEERADVPESLKNQLAKYRDAGVDSFEPSELIEFHRGLLEQFYPEFIRPREEVQRRVVIHADQTHRFILFLVFGCICLISAFVVDPNTTSIQRYYQEQLADAYLGGSDEAHNMRLADLTPRLGQGPLPMIGATANFGLRPSVSWSTATKETDCPDFAERIDQFEFSPLACGSRSLGFVETSKYYDGKIRLADAVAISGAALNPMYFQRWEMLIIFGLLNLRLGQWLPNPSPGTARSRPTFLKIVSDLFRFRDRTLTSVKERRHILVTDGGHYDNLGVQSLLARRCKVIVVCDATQDEDYKFDDLAELLGRVKGESGILLKEIDTGKELDLGSHAKDIEEGRCHHFCAEICYASPDERGLLIFFKSSLTGDESPFIWNHAQSNSAFPHDSTLNQAFQRNQFWAYLGLGQHLVDQAINNASNAPSRASTCDHNTRDFAEMFLGDLDPERREEFLDHLCCSTTDVQKSRSAVRDIIRQLRNSTIAKNWKLSTEAILSIQAMIDDLNPAARVPCYSSLLDEVGDVMAASVHDATVDANETCELAGRLFVAIVEHATDAKQPPPIERHVLCAQRLASEIQARFSNRNSVHMARAVICGDPLAKGVDLLEQLLGNNATANEVLVSEILSEIGISLVREGSDVDNRLQQVVALAQVSASGDVRELAEAVQSTIKKKKRPGRMQGKNR